jgi:hypothetical protein
MTCARMGLGKRELLAGIEGDPLRMDQGVSELELSLRVD